MSAVLHRLAPSVPHGATSRSARVPVAETLLLRFLVQHGIMSPSLLKLIDIERAGAGTSMSLLDWLVQRGHVSEEALTAALAACVRLHPEDLAPFARDQFAEETSDEGRGARRSDAPCPRHSTHDPSASKRRHLRLVSSRPDVPRSSAADRRAPRPHLVRRTA
jgi:hypothetical protein